MGGDAVALFRTHRAARRSNDTEYRFRPHSDFYYLTGLSEPEAACVLKPGAERPYRLFVRPRDPERETWDGRRVGLEGALAAYGADGAAPIGTLEASLMELLAGTSTVYVRLGEDPSFDAALLAAVATLRARERRGAQAPRTLVDPSVLLHEMRLRKGDDELATLRRAASITAEAHRAAMGATRPGVGEHELEALIDYTFRVRGGTGAGYTTIVGGGANGTVLHYIDNCAPLNAGELVLVDAGCEYDWYTADVTRTWPVSGTFTPLQRRAYEIVLEAQLAAIERATPGSSLDRLHEGAVEVLTRGMLELGLLSGSVAERIADRSYARYYMHRTSHWLGLDVHDVGRYDDGKGGARPLESGFVLTVEPGLYVPTDAADAPEGLRGLGIRIEDDVVVTERGPEVLTAGIPKTVAEVEAVVGRGAAPSR